MPRTFTLLVVLVELFAATNTHASFVADVTADWSDSSNPNVVASGAWSYRQGSTLLPHVADWTPLGASPQPAWAPGIISGNFLPAIFQATSSQMDWLTGDIVMHTTDVGNGGANGAGNVLWTSGFLGMVDITGAVWMARDIGRANDWFVYRNSTLLSFGHIESGDPYSRAHPFDLTTGSGGLAALTNISVSPGDTIRLELVRTTAAGDFVGLTFTISEVVSTPVPEPSSSLLFCMGVAAVFTRLCRRPNQNPPVCE